ncbi:MAG: YgfZ/GcvT domain-containing protein [Actinomycetota bacterium]
MAEFESRTCFHVLGGRAKLRFTGPQALWFLDQLVSNQVVKLEDGAGAQALLLTPHGKIESILRIVRLGEHVFVDAEPDDARGLLDFFQGRVFATKVAIVDVSEEFSVIRVMGPGSEKSVESLPQAPLPPGEAEHSVTLFDGDDDPDRPPRRLAVRIHRPEPGLDIWVSKVDEGKTLADLGSSGVEALSAGEYESLRVAGGVPLYGTDFDKSFLPQEAALEVAVHFQKGCYLGQESVAMAQRGRIKRRLRHLEFESTPQTGDVTYDGQLAGKVTSASTWEGRAWGIGVVKASAPIDEEVTVTGEDGSEHKATVRELPGTNYGPRVPSARELRERLQGA